MTWTSQTWEWQQKSRWTRPLAWLKPNLTLGRDQLLKKVKPRKDPDMIANLPLYPKPDPYPTNMKPTPPSGEKKSNILIEIKDQNFVKWLERMKTSSFRKDKTKYYQFHREHGHDINDYWIQKDEIEFLIRKGYLEQYARPKCNTWPCKEPQVVENNRPANLEWAK